MGKMVCEAATSEFIEKQATSEVCQLMKQYFPSVKFQPDCETAVTGVWDQVKALCPKGKETIMTLPTPEEIEKMVCEVATSEIIEEEGTEEACKLIKEYFPSVQFQPDCETLVKVLWDEVKAMCPKGKDSLVAAPSPADIEKLVREVAGRDLIEREATEDVCK